MGIPDEEVLAFAVADSRILLTLNRRDFIRLHRLNSNHYGIIVCTANTDFDTLAMRIHAEIEQSMGLEEQLIRIYRPTV